MNRIETNIINSAICTLEDLVSSEKPSDAALKKHIAELIKAVESIDKWMEE